MLKQWNRNSEIYYLRKDVLQMIEGNELYFDVEDVNLVPEFGATP